VRRHKAERGKRTLFGLTFAEHQSAGTIEEAAPIAHAALGRPGKRLPGTKALQLSLNYDLALRPGDSLTSSRTRLQRNDV
jgi:hypothetical protein